MTAKSQLLPEQKHADRVPSERQEAAGGVVFTRDHDVIRRWAAERGAEPATGEATRSGPATVNVNDGGAGIRFNFPGLSAFRPISWDEWFDNFDGNGCAFVFDADASTPPSSRYRIVRAAEWKEFLC
jgi:hypothetical protein